MCLQRIAFDNCCACYGTAVRHCGNVAVAIFVRESSNGLDHGTVLISAHAGPLLRV